MLQEYRLLDNHYVLHADGKPAGQPTAQLSLAFNRMTGELFKHGEPAMVQTWAALTLRTIANSSNAGEALDRVVVTGQLPLNEVNRCLREPDYCFDFYLKLMAGDLDPVQTAYRGAGSTGIH